MSIKQKDINFLVPLQQKAASQLTVAGQGPEPMKKGNLAAILLPCLAAVCFLGAFAFLAVSAALEQTKITTLELYLQSPETAAQYAQAQAEQARLDRYLSHYSAMAGYRAAIESYPKLNREIFDAVELAGGGVVTIESYSFNGESAALTMSAKTPVVGNCPVMVERLKATGYFSSVSYYGYGSDAGSYSFELTCVLNAPDGE